MSFRGAEAGAGVLLRPATPEEEDFEAPAADAAAEGCRFVARLAEEWRSGADRFDRPVEALLGAFRDGALASIGGLNADPYLPDADTGRLRHVYVRPAWRRGGVGEALTSRLLLLAEPRFRRARLRTGNPDAARLYGRCGFRTMAEPDATHAFDALR